MPDVTSIPGKFQETHYSYKIVKFVKEGGNSNNKKVGKCNTVVYILPAWASSLKKNPLITNKKKL